MNRFGDRGDSDANASTAPGSYSGRLTDVESYVSRMLQSPAKRKRLTIFCWEKDKHETLIFMYGRGAIQALLFVDCTNPVREQAIRRVFDAAAISPRQDELAGEP